MFTRLRKWLGLDRFPQRFGFHEGFDLDTWLCIATEGLCTEARERIEMEMRRHVTETAAELEAEGMSPAEAFDAALRQLGNAKAARRGFLRTNLMQSEYDLLIKHTTSPAASNASRWGKFVTGKFAIGYVVLFEFGVVFLFLQSLVLRGLYMEWDSLLFSQAMAGSLLALEIGRRYCVRGARRKAVGARVIFSLSWLMALPHYWMLGQRDSDARWFPLLAIAVAVLVVGDLFRFAPLWWKLGRASVPAKPEN